MALPSGDTVLIVTQQSRVALSKGDTYICDSYHPALSQQHCLSPAAISWVGSTGATSHHGAGTIHRMETGMATRATFANPSIHISTGNRILCSIHRGQKPSCVMTLSCIALAAERAFFLRYLDQQHGLRPLWYATPCARSVRIARNRQVGKGMGKVALTAKRAGTQGKRLVGSKEAFFLGATANALPWKLSIAHLARTAAGGPVSMPRGVCRGQRVAVPHGLPFR